MRVQAHLIAVMPSTTAQTPLGVKGLSSATAMFRVALHRQRVHHPQRRKGALGQDLADAERRVEFRLGVLPVNPGEHLLRAEELDRRELPLLAADKYAVVGGDQPGPMREVLRRPIGRQRRQRGASRGPGARGRDCRCRGRAADLIPLPPALAPHLPEDGLGHRGLLRRHLELLTLRQEAVGEGPEHLFVDVVPGIGHQRQGGRPMQGPGLEVLQHVRAGAGRLGDVSEVCHRRCNQGSRCHGGPGYAGDGRVQGWLEAKRALQKEEVPARRCQDAGSRRKPKGGKHLFIRRSSSTTTPRRRSPSWKQRARSPPPLANPVPALHAGRENTEGTRTPPPAPG